MTDHHHSRSFIASNTYIVVLVLTDVFASVTRRIKMLAQVIKLNTLFFSRFNITHDFIFFIFVFIFIFDHDNQEIATSCNANTERYLSMFSEHFISIFSIYYVDTFISFNNRKQISTTANRNVSRHKPKLIYS